MWGCPLPDHHVCDWTYRTVGNGHVCPLSDSRLVEARLHARRKVDANRGRLLTYKRQRYIDAPPELAAFEEPLSRVFVFEIRVWNNCMFGVEFSHQRRRR